MRIIKSILLVLIIVAIVVFTSQNMKLVNIKFLNWYLEIPLSVSSVLIYVLGAVSGGMLFSTIKKLSTKAFGMDKNTIQDKKTDK